MSDEIFMESSKSSIKRPNIESLNETCSSVNLPIIKKKKLDEQIGEPLWMGKRIIDNLNRKIFDTHEEFDIDEINNILRFLVKQSVYEDVKLFLIKHNFLCIAKYLLETRPSSETILHILRIITNLCYINEEIDAMGKAKSFVRAILYCLNCNDKLILRKMMKFLILVTCEIQINSQSAWIFRLKECKFFGKRIIYILESSEHTGVLMQLIQLLRSISEIILPDQTSFLKQLFEIDKLICALLISYTHIIPKFMGFHSTKQWNFIENWLALLTVRKIHIGVEKHITDDLYFNAKMILINTLVKFDSSDVSLVEYRVPVILNRSIFTMYKIVKFLLRFSYIPKTYGKTIDYLNGILLKIIILLDKGGLLLGDTELHLQDLKELLSKYWLRIIAQYTWQHILYILKSLSSDALKNDEAIEYLINLVQFDHYNVTQKYIKKLMKIKIALNIIRN